MKLHHLGYACDDIERALKYLSPIYPVKSISPIIFDELQDALVCLIEIEGNPSIELVAGEAVKTFTKHGLSLYHTCYEVPNIYAAIDKYTQEGASIVLKPTPAKLFDGRLVCFLQTDLGLIELLQEASNVMLSSNKNIKTTPKKNQILISATFVLGFFEKALISLVTHYSLSFEIASIPYRQLLQQLFDSGSFLRNNKNGFNIVFLRFEDWWHYKLINNKEIFISMETNVKDLLSALSLAAQDSSINYLICICPPSYQIVKDPLLKDLFKKTEEKIKLELARYNSFYFIDYNNEFYHQIEGKYYDGITNQLGHMPYTADFESLLAVSALRKIHAIIRLPYKVIVIDCDDTLWSGICGEAGQQGVTFPEWSISLQKSILAQFYSGIILCVCSKNNELDVFSVFEQRVEMVIKKEHITSWKINWKNKSENIIQLSKELNIDLNSFIFIDDNYLECAEVAYICPDVLVLQLPADQRYIPNFISNIWAFDHLHIVKEDHQRAKFYQQALKRKSAVAESKSLLDYLSTLETIIDIQPITQYNFERVAQLTLRVNQFNFTTSRYTTGQIEQLLKNGIHCLVVNVSDRFGDYGLVGAAFYQFDFNVLVIDNFILSCRALGFGVEHGVLSKLAKISQENAIKKITINFNKTKKNEIALSFLKSINKLNQEVGSDAGIKFSASAMDLINLRFIPYNILPKKENTSHLHQVEVQNRRLDNQIIQSIAKDFYSLDRLLKFIKEYSLEYKPIMDNVNIIKPNKLQQILIEIWQNVLHVNVIKINDNFFDLDGNSISALRIVSLIRQKLNVACEIRDIFDFPNIVDLAQCVLKLNKISPDNHSSLIPASYNQQLLWFINEMECANWFYNMPLILTLEGYLDVPALERAFTSIIERHASLRTILVNNQGKLFQKILVDFVFSLDIIDAKLLSRKDILKIIREEEKKDFLLSDELLIRTKLFIKNEKYSVLFINKHHIIADGWSDRILGRELSFLYNAYKNNEIANLPPLTLQYTDFSIWQHAQIDSGILDKQLNYWRKQFDLTPFSRTLVYATFSSCFSNSNGV